MSRMAATIGGRIFLDGKVCNVIYIMSVKLVPARAGICRFEAIQRAKLFRFAMEEELLCMT